MAWPREECRRSTYGQRMRVEKFKEDERVWGRHSMVRKTEQTWDYGPERAEVWPQEKRKQ